VPKKDFWNLKLPYDAKGKTPQQIQKTLQIALKKSYLGI
jgi:hypothetical protein